MGYIGSSMSSKATFAPSAAILRPHFKPNVPVPPVITTVFPWNLFLALVVSTFISIDFSPFFFGGAAPIAYITIEESPLRPPICDVV